MMFKNKKGIYFQKLNDETPEEDLHSQFQSLLSETMKGRSDLFRSGTLKTGSTATSENTQQIFFNQISNKYKPQLSEILQEKEILETSIDPNEWRKECERVKSHLNIKINKQATGTIFETEAEEINTRRNQILDHVKVVQEFAQSNVPLLIEKICEQWGNSLKQIRSLEFKLTSQNEDIINELKNTQLNKQTLLQELKNNASKMETKLQELDILERQCQQTKVYFQEKLDILVTQNNEQERINQMKQRLNDLKQEANIMHQREGIMRNYLEKYKLKQSEYQQEKKRQFDKKKKQQSLKITASKYSQIIKEDSKEDDDEFFERNKRLKHQSKTVEIEQKRKVDDDEEYSWDSDFD